MLEKKSVAKEAREDFWRHQRHLNELKREKTEMALSLGKANKEKSNKDSIIQKQKSELITLKKTVSLCDTECVCV